MQAAACAKDCVTSLCQECTTDSSGKKSCTDKCIAKPLKCLKCGSDGNCFDYCKKAEDCTVCDSDGIKCKSLITDCDQVCVSNAVVPRCKSTDCYCEGQSCYKCDECEKCENKKCVPKCDPDNCLHCPKQQGDEQIGDGCYRKKCDKTKCEVYVVSNDDGLVCQCIDKCTYDLTGCSECSGESSQNVRIRL